MRRRRLAGMAFQQTAQARLQRGRFYRLAYEVVGPQLKSAKDDLRLAGGRNHHHQRLLTQLLEAFQNLHAAHAGPVGQVGIQQHQRGIEGAQSPAHVLTRRHGLHLVAALFKKLFQDVLQRMRLFYDQNSGPIAWLHNRPLSTLLRQCATDTRSPERETKTRYRKGWLQILCLSAAMSTLSFFFVCDGTQRCPKKQGGRHRVGLLVRLQASASY